MYIELTVTWKLFPKIALHFHMPKTNCPMSASKSLSQRQLTKSCWTRHCHRHSASPDVCRAPTASLLPRSQTDLFKVQIWLYLVENPSLFQKCLHVFCFSQGVLATWRSFSSLGISPQYPSLFLIFLNQPESKITEQEITEVNDHVLDCTPSWVVQWNLRPTLSCLVSIIPFSKYPCWIHYPR